jgi:hypothetical protein
MKLGDMAVLEPYPPAKLLKALAVIADTLHPVFDADTTIRPFASRGSCVLSSLTVRDFLIGIGFKAFLQPVAAVIWAQGPDGKQLHSLAIGAPHDGDSCPLDNRWNGHAVVTVKFRGSEYLIDTTLYQVRRKQWPELPGMIALPTIPAAERVRSWWGLGVFATASMDDIFVGWFDNPKNKAWEQGPDGRDPFRRASAIRKLTERFGRWEG